GQALRHGVRVLRRVGGGDEDEVEGRLVVLARRVLGGVRSAALHLGAPGERAAEVDLREARAERRGERQAARAGAEGDDGDRAEAPQRIEVAERLEAELRARRRVELALARVRLGEDVEAVERARDAGSLAP